MLAIPMPPPSTSSSTSPASPPVKRRAACDECRTKKLKCSGEQPACSRCAREHLGCVYSAQKPMGRPKKRQRIDDEAAERARTRTESDASSQRQTKRREPDWSLSLGEQLGVGSGSGEDDGGVEGGSGGPGDWLTQGGTGNVQPWFQTADWAVPSEHAMPGLTADDGTNSPPTINLPLDLLSTALGTSGSGRRAATEAVPQIRALPPTHAHGHEHTGSTGLLLHGGVPMLDPSLSPENETHRGMPPPNAPECACLSTLYLTLNTLQSMPPDFPFPTSLHPLRAAMQTAHDVLSCTACPTKFLSAVQNTQLAGTLLMSIAERFSKVLAAISAEAERAEREAETKRFRLADLNTSTAHLHAGGLGCAAAFSIDLSGSEWRVMAKKVVRAEVYGPQDGNTCCPYLLGVIGQMENRQEHWHGEHGEEMPMPADFPRDPLTGVPMGGKFLPKEDHVCVKLCAYARKLVEGYDWV